MNKYESKRIKEEVFPWKLKNTIVSIPEK